MLADVEPLVSSPVLVGRSSQLSTLDTALAEAGLGHPSAVLVGGKAAEYVASIRSALDRARYKDEHQLPLTRLETELRLAQDRPAEALAVIGDALDRFDLLRSPRYGWPLLTAAARACAPARDRRGPGTAHQGGGAARTAAHRPASWPRKDWRSRLTSGPSPPRCAAPTRRRRHGARKHRAGKHRPGNAAGSSGIRAAWDDAAQAWEAVGQPYPLAAALLRMAEAALSAGDRDAGGMGFAGPRRWPRIWAPGR